MDSIVKLTCAKWTSNGHEDQFAPILIFLRYLAFPYAYKLFTMVYFW